MMTYDHFACHVTFTTKFFMSYIPFRGVVGCRALKQLLMTEIRKSFFQNFPSQMF